MSVSISAGTEPSSQQSERTPVSVADTPATTTAISWVSRGYQHSISAGGGGTTEDADHDTDPDVVVNKDSNSHRVKVRRSRQLIPHLPRLKLTQPVWSSTWVAAAFSACPSS